VNGGGTPLAERLLAGLGALVLVVVIGALLREAWVQPADPMPQIELLVERTEQDSSGWLLIVKVSNEGASAARDTTVEARVSPEGAPAEWHAIQLTELAAHGEERVVFRFEREPTAEALSLTVGGFSLP
jgi:uncharacterized protein (TIGR02588 family)